MTESWLDDICLCRASSHFDLASFMPHVSQVKHSGLGLWTFGVLHVVAWFFSSAPQMVRGLVCFQISLPI